VGTDFGWNAMVLPAYWSQISISGISFVLSANQNVSTETIYRRPLDVSENVFLGLFAFQTSEETVVQENTAISESDCNRSIKIFEAAAVLSNSQELHT